MALIKVWENGAIVEKPEGWIEPFEPPHQEPTIPPPSKLVMSGSGLRVVDYALTTAVAGYNFGGGFEEEAGVYIVFPLQEIEGPIDCWFSVGGGFTMLGQLLDQYTVRIEARDINGNLANPDRFSMRIYQP